MKYKFKNSINNRKSLYLLFGIVLVSVFTLTVAYAALNTVLKITGNAEVSSASWDIYLDNVQLVSGSATQIKPTITNKTTASFTTTLTNPGDYYMFTIDVVNNGSIDAMINSIEKLPQLSEIQAKYLNYIVEYQNGESINTKQLVEKNSFVRLKVKVEFRKDISSFDLPATSQTLNLSFKVNYVQASESGTSNITNSGKLVKVVSGDYDTVGSEICIGEECFYVISSTENDVTMLAKYNLYVGYSCSSYSLCMPITYSTGIQDSTAKGYIDGFSEENPMIGVRPFANTNYWASVTSSYPVYVYNEKSYLFEHIEYYKSYLSGFGIAIDDARLITYEELEKLGCSGSNGTCGAAPEWVYSTSFWTGAAYSTSNIWYVNSTRVYHNYVVSVYGGVRPVITISKLEF